MLDNYKCRVTMILVRNEFALTKFRQTSIMWILRRLMQAWWRISPSQKIDYKNEDAEMILEWMKRQHGQI